MQNPSARKASFLDKKDYGILGAGRSGLAAAHLLLDLNKSVTLFDDAADPATPAAAALAERGATVRFGAPDPAWIEGLEALIVSPGIPAQHPLLAEARRRGLALLGEIELGWLRAGAAKFAAITGTNGKTTVTMLVEKIFQDAGLRGVSAGNIGLPLCDAVRQAGDALDQTYFSLEVSSFQLDTCEQFAPEVGVILNVTPDHLDRHPTMEDYARAKERVAVKQGPEQTLIVNQDDSWCLAIAARAAARVKRFSLERPVEDGAYLDGDLIILAQPGRKPYRLMSMHDLQMVGMHNVANAMAAACVAEAFGLDRKRLARSLAEFKAAPHRMEIVAVHEGVTYLDDSKATNIDAMVRAIESFSQGIHLIAGGRDKNSPFETITDLLAARVKTIYLIGEAAEPMAKAWAGRIECLQCGTMDRALEAACARAASGETVMLSPGCASFDQFHSYAHRGEVFAALVRDHAGLEQPAVIARSPEH
jgi:UDP-N-acetylmuramoylalanine--D-glutamate ligase